MTTISMLDKLKTVFTLSDNIFNIVIIAFLAFISFLFITTNKNNAKDSRKAYIALYAILFAVILIRYYDSIPIMFDYFMDNVFSVIYFPNIAVYIGAIIFANIIMLISIFSSKTHKYIKPINVIVTSTLDYIFILFVNLVNNKKIDVFNIDDLYSSKDIHSLIELSSNIFILWLSFLIIFKIVSLIIDKKNEKEVTNITVEHIGERKEENKKSINVPDSIILTHTPLIIKREEAPIKPKEDTSMYDGMFTVDDYKTVLEILKENKNKKMEEKNNYNVKITETPKKYKEDVKDLLSLYK